MKLFSIFLVLGFGFFSTAGPVQAHAFGATYTLPIPFWLYLYTGAAALLLSFLIIGFFFSKREAGIAFPTKDISSAPIIRFIRSKQGIVLWQSLSLFFFTSTILTGLIGEDLSAFNFNMTFFWIVFVVGFTYLTFLIGNIWDTVNPWKILIELYEQGVDKKLTGILSYPETLRYYPAVILYLVFISVELFFGTTPFSLSVILLQYTFITCFGTLLFGKNKWFTYGEFFSVFFRLLSNCSVVSTDKKKTLLRLPFSGLVQGHASDFSQLLFILSMLASTAFDGLRETNAWFSFYWESLAPFLEPLFGSVIAYRLYEQTGLIIAPFVFLLLYVVSLLLLKSIVRTSHTLGELASYFAFSLIPIVIVYNLAHYFTLLLLQGQVMVRLISDPFGWGWNMFGTADFLPDAGMLSASFVWHFQVAVILIGHIVSVYIAHILALHLFKKNSKALLSQLPLLVLMVAYTVIGLWILSQPLGIK